MRGWLWVNALPPSVALAPPLLEMTVFAFTHKASACVAWASLLRWHARRCGQAWRMRTCAGGGRGLEDLVLCGRAGLGAGRHGRRPAQPRWRRRCGGAHGLPAVGVGVRVRAHAALGCACAQAAQGRLGCLPPAHRGAGFAAARRHLPPGHVLASPAWGVLLVPARALAGAVELWVVGHYLAHLLRQDAATAGSGASRAGGASAGGRDAAREHDMRYTSPIVHSSSQKINKAAARPSLQSSPTKLAQHTAHPSSQENR